MVLLNQEKDEVLPRSKIIELERAYKKAIDCASPVHHSHMNFSQQMGRVGVIFSFRDDKTKTKKGSELAQSHTDQWG